MWETYDFFHGFSVCRLGLKVSVPHVTSSGDLEKKEGVCKCGVCVRLWCLDGRRRTASKKGVRGESRGWMVVDDFVVNFIH